MLYIFIIILLIINIIYLYCYVSIYFIYKKGQYEKAMHIFNYYGPFLTNQLENDSIHFQQMIKNTTIAQSLEKINKFYDDNRSMLMTSSMKQKGNEQENILWRELMNIIQFSGPADLDLLVNI